jgi:uncharacterized membrane protein
VDVLAVESQVSLHRSLESVLSRVRFEPRWFFLFYLLAGLAYLILTGPFRAPDERNHFLRAYEISEGRLNRARVAGSVTGDELPTSLTWLSEVLGVHSEHHITTEQMEAARALRLVPKDRRFIEFSTTIYSPLAYAPAALAVRLGRMLGAGPLALVYFARSANLLVGSALMTLALAHAGYARRTLFLLAILPMTLSQISTVTADAMSYALSFLWVSVLIETALQRSVGVTWKRIALLLGLALGLSQLRPSYPLLGLLAFVFPVATMGRKSILLALALAGASLLPAVGWSVAIAPLAKQAAGNETVNPTEQAQWVLNHAGVFWHRAKGDLWEHGADYWEQFVGRLGWLNIVLPLWIPIGFAVMLALGIFLAPRGPPSPAWWQRTALAVMAFIGIFAIQLALYLTFNPVKSPFISGVQGRYFTPLMVLAMFAVTNSRLTRPASERWFKLGCALFGFVANCGALFAVARAAGKI